MRVESSSAARPDTAPTRSVQRLLILPSKPHFVQLQKTYIDGLKSVIHSAKETQKDALKGISVTLENITDLLRMIIQKSETEELRSEIANIALKLADYGLEIAKIIQETNKEKTIHGSILQAEFLLCFLLLVVFGFVRNKSDFLIERVLKHAHWHSKIKAR